MDDVELAILDAWHALAPRLAGDPRELRRRLARRSAATFVHPPRSACLTLRATDRRLDDVRQLVPHDVMITADQLRALSVPITLEPPGGSLADVGRLLGVSRGGLLRARVDKTFRQRYIEGLGGRWGHPRPILYTDAQLDPNGRGFAMPDPAWSWTTRYLAHRLPPDFPDQMLRRVPRYHPRGGAGAADRYRDTRGLHPEHPLVAGDDAPRLRKSLALPDPPPDDASYKWKNGVYLGYDWRNPLARRNYKRHQRQLGKARLARKKRRCAEKGPAQSERSESRGSKGSLEFRGWSWLCPGCDRPARILYLPLPPVNLIAAFHHSRGDYAEYAALIAGASGQRAVGSRQNVQETKKLTAPGSNPARCPLPTAYCLLFSSAGSRQQAERPGDKEADCAGLQPCPLRAAYCLLPTALPRTSPAANASASARPAGATRGRGMRSSPT